MNGGTITVGMLIADEQDGAAPGELTGFAFSAARLGPILMPSSL